MAVHMLGVEEGRTGRLSITNGEKILLLLSEFRRYEKDYRLPEELSQDGIARVVGMRRGNVARELIKLKKRGFVHDKLTHFEGIKRRKKGYFLTDTGFNLSADIRNSIGSKSITFKAADGKESIADFDSIKRTLGKDVLLAKIVCSTSEDCVFDAKSLEPGYVERPCIEEMGASRLAGRKQELEQIHDIIEKALAGRGTCLLLSGEAGIGKTRLANEGIKLYGEKNAFSLTGKCLYQTAVDPYLPFVDALGDFLRTAGRDLKASTLENIKSSAPELASILPSAASDGMVGIPLVEREMNIEAERLRIFEAYNNVLVGIADERPVILFVDDLQWADSGSIHLLHYLTRNIEEEPILIIGAYRPEELVPENGNAHPFMDALALMRKERLAIEIDVGRLSIDETTDMIGSRLGISHVPLNLASLLYDESDGNPFFIEELLDSLEEDGLLKGMGDEWVISSKVNIPETIKEVVGRRVSRLRDGDRKLLEFASAIGERFDIELLHQSSHISEEKLLDAVDNLLDAGLICEESSGIGAYRFHHGKIRDVVYEDLNPRRRLGFHESIGDTIERVYGDELDEVVNDLAYHYSLTRRFEKAYEYHQLAGDNAYKLFAVHDALSHYESAIDALLRSKDSLLDSDRRTMELQMKTGSAHDLLSDWGAALNSYNEALKISESIGDRTEKCRILGKIAFVSVRKGEFDEAERLCQSALREIQNRSDKNAAQIYEVMGMIAMRRGEYEKALSHCSKSLDIAKKTGDKSRVASANSKMGLIYSELCDYEKSLMHNEHALRFYEKTKNKNDMGTALFNMGVCYWSIGKYDKAIEYCNRTLDIMTEIGNKSGIAFAHNLMGATYHNQGDFIKALEHFEKSLRVRERIGEKRGIAEGFNNVGCIHKNMEKYEEAFECFERSLTILNDIGDRRGCAIALFELGDTYLRMGNLEKGMESFERSLETCERIGDRLFSAYDYCGIAECLIGLDRLGDALRCAKKALEISMEIDAKEVQLWGRRLVGMIHGEKEEWDAAIENFNSSIDIGKEIKSEVELGKTYCEFAEMWKKKGETDKAFKYLSLALKIFEEKNLARKAERVKKELGEIGK